MATFLGTSNIAKTATSTASKIIQSNSLYGTLPIGQTVFRLESTNDYPLIQISAKSTRSMSVLVQQSFDNVFDGALLPSLVTTEAFTVPLENPINGGTTALTFYAEITYPFFRIVLVNLDGTVGSAFITTKLVSSITASSSGAATVAIQGSNGLTFAQTAGAMMMVYQTPPTRLTLTYTTPKTVDTANAPINIQASAPFYWDMFGGTEGFKYRSITVFARVGNMPIGFTQSTPIIALQYSNDATNWYGDGQYPILQLLSGSFGNVNAVVTFSMVGASVYARYVRLWATAGTYIIQRLEANFQTDVASTA